MELSKTKARKLLEEIYKLSVNSSMTGALTDGYEILYTTYNKIRDTAIANGWIDGEWVAELKKGENLNEGEEWEDVIGTAAKLFLIQLEDEKVFEYVDNESKSEE